MMKLAYCWIGALLPLMGLAQTTARHPWPLQPNTAHETLFFIPNAVDTTRCTGSVETTSGTVILPDGFWMPGDCEDVPERTLWGNFTLIVPRSFTEPVTDTAMHYSYGFATFNQEGRFLHHPFIFDNGPDYWREGRRRVVEDGKMGLVNRLGEWIIPVGEYRFLEPVEKGLVWACRDCSFYNPLHEEHGGEFKGSDWDLLSVDGKVLAKHLKPGDKRTAGRWQQTVAATRKAPVLSKLTARLLSLPQVAAYAAMYHTPLTELHFVCYDLPSNESPYYHLGLESRSDNYFPGDEMQVLISPDGSEIYHLEEDLQELVPLNEWRVAD
ncbi:MAG: hypothetical protein EOP52_02965 [Sphingobacteriales bacterium]|nr:MAG: hypothetical protein EOP52_02965 [Sphingobacteriales bacterium]